MLLVLTKKPLKNFVSFRLNETKFLNGKISIFDRKLENYNNQSAKITTRLFYLKFYFCLKIATFLP